MEQTAETTSLDNKSETPTYTKEFTEEIQQRIVEMLFYDHEAFLKVNDIIKPEYFESPVLADLTKIILDYHDKYPEKFIDIEELTQELDVHLDTSKKPLPREVYQEQFVKLLTEGASQSVEYGGKGFQYVLDQVISWSQYQSVKMAILKSIDLLQKKKDYPGILREIKDAVEGAGGCRKAVILNGSDVVLEDIEWLWHNRIPKNKLSILAGKPQEGKSWFTVMMAAHITSGTPFPNESHRPVKQGHVLVLQAEDGIADTWMKRFLWEGGKPEFLHFITGVRAKRKDRLQYFNLAGDLDLFQNSVREIGHVELAIVDPMMSYVGSKVDAKAEQEVRPMIQALMDLAAEEKVTIQATTHLNKNEAADSLQRLMGSVAFGAAPRFVQLIGRQRGERDQRFFMVMKATSVPEPEQRMAHFGFRIEENHIQLTPAEQPPENADELLAPPVMDDAKDRRTKVGAARAYIEDLIKRGIPTVLASEAKRKVRDLAWSGWKGVREEYGIVSEPVGGHDFLWHIPEKIVEQN